MREDLLRRLQGVRRSDDLAGDGHPHHVRSEDRRRPVDRAIARGVIPVNGLVTDITVPETTNGNYKVEYSKVDSTGKQTLEFDYIIGADGANSRLAKAMGAGEYNYAIAFQERIKVSDEKMKFYEELAEMYVGDDVSPDFYGWVFPKCVQYPIQLIKFERFHFNLINFSFLLTRQ